ncbi:protein GRINL1A isoform X1 [Takifugu flavidus]|uniref:DNA-directed RNA polymerase II subunit GRINL1A n=3 Tax=Takifugu TaxID=31032 RepID=A0A5C6NKJ3_9TELE|nr:protein GRINL1A isoform X1 [Takifugu flavidus]TNM91129.1 hypothetical protein fugu_003418 [Takifugu bimaculatus]TWW68082.1 hypothetical protein D4764_02G0011230 [Takifugu flavidus]
MSVSREGQKVGDLKNLSKETLQEILLRQEKILTNQRIMRSLPDKGSKIREYVEKVRLAIQLREEEERRQAAAQAKLSQQLQELPSEESESIEMLIVSGSSDGSKDSDLVRSLEMMSVSDSDNEFRFGSKPSRSSAEEDNYFTKPHKEQKSHNLVVLEKTNPSTKQKFKPNQFLQRENTPAKDKYQNHPPAHPDQGGAQFLSLKESAELLQNQFRKRKELEARVAANILSEGRKVLMEDYNPDESAVTSYREAHAKEDQHSSDEDVDNDNN